MEQHKPAPASGPKDEISLKELILTLQEWVRYLFSKWLIIVIVGLLGGVIGLCVSLLKKDTYVGYLTFVLEENKSNGLGAYAGLASQFGIDLGGGSGSGVFSGDNIMTFLKSRMMIQKTLLSSITINNKETTLAEYYMDIYEWRKNWKGKPELQKIHFTPGMDTVKLNRTQDSLLLSMYRDLNTGQLDVMKPEKKLSFIAVQLTTVDETFSKVFIERLVKEATDFYIQTKTKKSQATVNRLQAKADSLEELLNKKTYSVAAAQDINMNPVRSVAKVGAEMGQRDKVVLQTMYGEVVKNLEMSRMAMSQETPLIQIVDPPMLPLEKKRLGKTKGIIVGGLLAGFLSIAFLLTMRLYKKIVA